jgi:small conductance mechanosensitive channel
MNELDVAVLSKIDWVGFLATVKTSGLEFGVKILVALVIFYAGRTVARMLTKTLHKIMQKQEVDKILETFVCNLVYWLIMLFVIIASINHIGVETTSLIAVMGAAGLAIGLALQGSLSNFAAGVLIVIFRPYRVGDYVEAAGVAGTIMQVQILTTMMKTPDNKEIIVPNSQIMGSIIINYSANETRRVDMTIGVSYGDDLDKVRKTIQELVTADERILKDPACLIAVSELADSSVNFTVRPWVSTADYWAVKFELTEAIKKRFDQEGISIPFPQRDVHVYKQG